MPTPQRTVSTGDQPVSSCPTCPHLPPVPIPTPTALLKNVGSDRHSCAQGGRGREGGVEVPRGVGNDQRRGPVLATSEPHMRCHCAGRWQHDPQLTPGHCVTKGNSLNQITHHLVDSTGLAWSLEPRGREHWGVERRSETSNRGKGVNGLRGPEGERGPSRPGVPPCERIQARTRAVQGASHLPSGRDFLKKRQFWRKFLKDLAARKRTSTKPEFGIFFLGFTQDSHQF